MVVDKKAVKQMEKDELVGRGSNTPKYKKRKGESRYTTQAMRGKLHCVLLYSEIR